MSKSTVVKIRSLGRVGMFVVALLLISYELEIIQAKEPTLADHYLKNYNFSEDWFSHNLLLFKKTFDHLKGKPNIHYLEIGVFEGASAIWMLENILTAPTARMTCIDIFFGDLQEKFLANLRISGFYKKVTVIKGRSQVKLRYLPQKFLANLRISGFYKKVTVIKGRSQVELRYLPLNSFDIVYIDGSHTAKDVLADAILSWELLKPGGIMFFDDYLYEINELPVERRPQIAIDSFISAFKNDIEIIHHGFSVILKKR